MSTRKIRFALPLAVFLGSCAGLSEQECKTASWETIGYEHGVAGRSAQHLGHYRKACSAHGVTPDLAAYRRGRELGLLEFCQPARAYQLGRQGAGYPGVCPNDADGTLRSAFQAGSEVHHLEGNLRHTQRQLARKNGELKQLRKALVGQQVELVAPDTSEVRRVQLVTEIWQSKQREGDLEVAIAELEYEIARKRERLTSARADHDLSW